MSYVVEESWERHTYVKGYYDARLAGAEALPSVDDHWSVCFDLRHQREVDFPEPPAGTPPLERKLRLGTVDTEYVSFYRIQSKKHFKWGDSFPDNWLDDERKRSAHQRFSPIGTVGHYFGLTADAALDEALYYGHGAIDSSAAFFLMIRCYFENILYLTQVATLSAVWTILDLGPASLGEMHFRIMDPATDNEVANRIGTWARARGFSGMIFPSARYGQRLDIVALRAAGRRPFPALNAVSIGCHLDKRVQLLETALADDLIYESADIDGGTPLAIYAEPNLVLFSGEQLRGNDRAIFYVGVPIEDRDVLVAVDERPQKKNIEHWMDD